MTLIEKLKKISAVFGSVEGCDVYHYSSPMEKSAPFIVWMETESDDFHANNRTDETYLKGQVDLFMLEEFDPAIDELVSVMDYAGMTHKINSIMYEDNTNLIHYSWDWWC